jgi:ligand-binding sensor domain-containing protein
MLQAPVINNMTHRFLFILPLFLFSTQCISAQFVQGIENIEFENYTPRNGLTSDFIETITQDKYGFIWLGTHNGLVQFDGVQFKTYVHNNADSNGLPDNDTRSIISDMTGKVWIASKKGLFYYNYATDHFIKITIAAGDQPINWVTCPVLDKQQHLWFLCRNGIYRLDVVTCALRLFHAEGTRGEPFSGTRLFSTTSGKVYFASQDALYFFDPAVNVFRQQPIINIDGLLFKNGISTIYEEDKNKLWIASFSGLYLLNTETGTTRRYGYKKDYKTDDNIVINSFSFCPSLTGDSVLWCATPHHGLVLFNLHAKQFIQSFVPDHYDVSSIGGLVCYNNFTDRDGILWISHMNGLSKLDWHNQQIKSYQIKVMADSNEMEPPVRKIVADVYFPENYWLMTWGYGILYYNKKLNKLIDYSHGKRFTGSNNNLFSYDALYDDQKILWVGAGNGLSFYERSRDRFVNIKTSSPVLPGDTVILRILKDKNNHLWLGTDAGLWRFDISTRQFVKFHATNPADSVVVNSSVYTMHFDLQDKLYIGTGIGMYVLDTSTGQITLMVRPSDNNHTNLNINYIWGIDVDRNNNVWVATRGGGLYRYDPAGKTYTDFKMGNGLTTEELRDVFVDSLQHIWISSYDGIFKLDQQTKIFTRFTPEDGLGSFNISLGRWSIINNKIYSGSPGAYSIIDPYTSKPLTSHFPVWITAINLPNRIVHFSPDSAIQMRLPVKYPDNSVSFEFTAISYTASTSIKYAYRLEGFEKDWQYVGNRRFANYNNLAGGSYTFHVKAMNAAGLWSDSNTQLTIVVKPPFRDTGWFRLLLALAIAGMITAGVQKRIATIRKQAAFRQQQAVFGQKLAETEMMALRAQMNPHFIFNCMNIIDSLITGNRKEDAQDFLQKFSKLIRLVLENSQHQQVPLKLDLQALQLYIKLEAIRSDHHFTYELDVDQELIEKDFTIPPLLLQPYIENAILHGLRNKEKGTGRLLIRIKKSNGKIMVTIEDNGIGRKKSMLLNAENKKPHEHLGIKVTNKRINLLRMMNQNEVEVYTDDVCQEDETGTRVTILLPQHIKFE